MIRRLLHRIHHWLLDEPCCRFANDTGDDQ